MRALGRSTPRAGIRALGRSTPRYWPYSKTLLTSMLADMAFGSDENVQKAKDIGVELVSPVRGQEPENHRVVGSGTLGMEPLTIDDFAMDERTGKVTQCPVGRIPLQTIYDAPTGTTTIEMDARDCENCAFRTACPIQKKPECGYRLKYTDKQRRLEERRQEAKTEEFKKRYAKRSGGESTNSGLKRRLGLGKLRVRGQKAVYHAIYLKVAGWNLLRAVASGRLAGVGMAGLGFAQWLWCLWKAYLMQFRDRGRNYSNKERIYIPLMGIH